MTPTAVADPIDQFLSALTERMQSGRKALPGASNYFDFASGFKHDSGGNPITIGYSHGDGGNLAFPGVDPDVFHTVVGNRGILGQLPARASIDQNPLYSIITGVSADVGNEKDDVCEDAPVAGLMEACIVTSVFGRYERSTSELEINRLGMRRDRSDPMDLALVGSPIAQQGIWTTGPAGDPAGLGADVLRNETTRKFWELSVSLHRLLSVQIWRGNPRNNSANGGYKELTGFDSLIRTGYVDAITGERCETTDSLVLSASFADVADNGVAMVNMLVNAYHTRKDLAERTGVMPVRWVLAMRPEVFFELSAVWPCAYLTYRCALEGITGAVVNIDAAEQTRMRDDFRNGRYLLIDGDRVEVVLDDGIRRETSTEAAGVPEAATASSVYLIPMSVVGGRAVTYLEYADFNNPSLQAALGNMVLARVEGPWITTVRQTNWCVQWQTKIEPRLVMRTPWLAARIDNVVTSPLLNTVTPFPDDPYAFPTGGTNTRPGPSYYQLYNQV